MNAPQIIFHGDYMRRINPEAPLTSSQRNKRHYERHRESELERNRVYHQDHKDEIRIRHRHNRHRLTQQKYDEMFAKQDGKCAICFKPLIETPHIDHKHSCCTGNRSCDNCRRELLCKHCNILVGMCFESTVVLQSATQYLERHNNVIRTN